MGSTARFRLQIRAGLYTFNGSDLQIRATPRCDLGARHWKIGCRGGRLLETCIAHNCCALPRWGTSAAPTQPLRARPWATDYAAFCCGGGGGELRRASLRAGAKSDQRRGRRESQPRNPAVEVFCRWPRPKPDGRQPTQRRRGVQSDRKVPAARCRSRLAASALQSL